MRRLARHLLIFCTVFSLMLCLIALAMLVRSLFVRDQITWATGGGSLVAVHTREQRLCVTVVGPGWTQARQLRWRCFAGVHVESGERLTWAPRSFRRAGGWAGLRIVRGAGWWLPPSPITGPPSPIRHLSIRWEAISLLTALLPLARGVAALHRRRLTQRRGAAGRCPSCGYDLRVQLAQSAHRESNGRASPMRCPECGTIALKGTT